MGKFELFVKRVYELATELKIPLIDERVYDKVSLNSKKAAAQIIFEFEEDESVIRGFLGLADFFHTVIIKRKNTFYILSSSMLFVLESS